MTVERVEIKDSNPPADGALNTPGVDPGKAAPATPPRPAGLPDKFKSVEEMAASYTALETKLGTPPADPLADPPADPPPEGDGKPVIPEVPAEPWMSKYETEFDEKGEMSPESYAELETRGLSKDHVDAYIAGKLAKADGEKTAVFEAVGGEERWNEMMPWAGKNLPEARKNEINAMLAAGGEGAVIAAQALQASFAEANGLDPNYVNADGIATDLGGVFESTAQVQAAMRDPRYKTDPAYQKEVAVKLSRSNNLM
jgi:hypothetical protein